MDKRTKIALLILVFVLLMAFGIWMFLSPIRENQQPPAPQGGSPYVATSTRTPTPQPTTSTPIAPESLPVDPMRQLQNQAKNIIERMGSGSSQTGFLGYQDALLDMTASGRTMLQAERAALQKAHPATGPLYAMTSRAVSSIATQGKIGDAMITISVEVIQTIDAEGKRTSQAKRASVRFQRQTDGTYLGESIAWVDVSL